MIERGGIKVESIIVRDISFVDEIYLKKYKFYEVSEIKYDEFYSDVVYIATPISTHVDIIRESILNGKNVICEKPVCIKYHVLEELYNLAEKNGVYLNQVLMYKYHKAFEYALDIVNSKRFGKLTNIKTSFKIPHLNKHDIRYKKSMLGGALYDVGFYPISLALSIVENAELTHSKYDMLDGYDVDLVGKCELINNDVHCIAEWAIGSEYENYVSFKFDSGVEITIDRFFSKPYDYEVIANIVNKCDVYKEVIGCDDQFKNMFNVYLKDRESKDLDLNLNIIKLIEKIAS